MSGLRDRLLRMRGSAALRDELRAGMPDPDFLGLRQAEGVAVSDHCARCHEVAAEFADQVDGLIERQAALGLDLHPLEIAHAQG